MQKHSQDPIIWLSPVTAWLGWGMYKQLVSGPSLQPPQNILMAPCGLEWGLGSLLSTGAKPRWQKEPGSLSSSCGAERALSVHTHLPGPPQLIVWCLLPPAGHM